MIFESREEAAQSLAKALQEYAGRAPLVLGIPRGAVPMAAIVAAVAAGARWRGTEDAYWTWWPQASAVAVASFGIALIGGLVFSRRPF